MKLNVIGLILFFTVFLLSACNFQAADNPTLCEEGYILEGSSCIIDDQNVDQEECLEGYTKIDGVCTIDTPADTTEPIMVYFEKPTNWADSYLYYYDTNLGNPITWEQAVQMRAWYGHLGWYYYELPDDIESARIIFKSSDDNQIPPAMQPGLMIGETTWFYSDYSATVNNPFE